MSDYPPMVHAIEYDSDGCSGPTFKVFVVQPVSAEDLPRTNPDADILPASYRQALLHWLMGKEADLSVLEAMYAKADDRRKAEKTRRASEA